MQMKRFCLILEFEVDELIGRSTNVRHPDMPKSYFQRTFGRFKKQRFLEGL